MNGHQNYYCATCAYSDEYWHIVNNLDFEQRLPRV